MNHLQYALSMFPPFRRFAAQRAAYETSVLKVMTVLPGKYRYEQVEGAIRASDAPPEAIYYCLAANWHTSALARFYEALHGPGKEQAT